MSLKFSGVFPVFVSLAICVARAEVPVEITTNAWALGPEESLDRTTFVVAPEATMEGEAKNDSFWISQGALDLQGRFQNDVWALADSANLRGQFADHARVIGRAIQIDGIISNGVWAAGVSISCTTNSILHGDNLLAADVLSLLGNVHGNLYARGNKITLGGTITGDVYLYGDDIVLRPGTTVLGSLRYITGGQPVVLDANSQVAGELDRVEKPAETATSNFQFYAHLFWWIAALMVGLPFMFIFPNFTGRAVQGLRASFIKCGLFGLLGLIITPFLIIIIFITIVGIPMAFLLGASYWLIIYLGKFPVALAIGTLVLQRRGQISLSSAVLSLVIGLILYYSVTLVPVIGSSLQSVATAFGVGSILVALAAGRGRISQQVTSDEPRAQV